MKIKHIIIFTILLSIILSGCRQNKWTTTTEEFNLDEAKIIHRTAWDPVYKMTDKDNVITPSVKVRTLEEFVEVYGFTNMSETMVMDHVFCQIVNGDARDPQKDDSGYILFGNDETIVTADNLINDDIYIDHAYIETRVWEDAGITETSLVIVERSRPGKTKTDDFERLNYFEKNAAGEWILTNISGNGIVIIIYSPDSSDKN